MTYVAVTVLRAPSPQLHPVRFFSSVGHSGRLLPARPSDRPGWTVVASSLVHCDF